MCEEALSSRLYDMMGETWDEESQSFKPYISYEGKEFIRRFKKLLELFETEGVE